MKRRTSGFVVLILLAGSESALASGGDLLQVFTDPDPGLYHGFGWSIAAVGGNVLVGAPNNITGVADTGDAYLFTSQGTLLHHFQNPTGRPNDGFGFSVAAVGGNLLIGAPGDDVAYTDSGAVYLFSPAGTHLQSFLNPNPAADDTFGVAVAARGTAVFIGANGSDLAGSDAGAVYEFDSGTGALVRTILNPRSAEYELFGGAVATVGDNLVVGARGKFPGPGVAYLLDSSGSLLHTLRGDPTDWLFGSSVAAVGSNILIGAPGHFNGDTETPGAAYLFDGTSGQRLQKFENPSPDFGDCFGISVAGVGDNVLIGAYTDDTYGTNAGIAYLFDQSGALLLTLHNPAGGQMGFGRSVDALGNELLVGMPSAYRFEAVPEPSTLVLLSMGALACTIGWWRCTRKVGHLESGRR